MQSELINAVNGAQRKQFTQEQWNDLPADKYGWKIATEAPEEVAALFGNSNALEGQPSLEEREANLKIGIEALREATNDFYAQQEKFNKEVAAFEAKKAAIRSPNGSTAKNGTNGNSKK